MIGRRPLPAAYIEWNQTWGAPEGHPGALSLPPRTRFAQPMAEMGPFAFQVAGGTHAFEYPWAYFSAAAGAGTRLLDVAGGLGGLQFVFALDGCRVVNVDWAGARPTTAVSPWSAREPELHARLNAVFGTDVRLVRTPLPRAGLPPGSFDRAVCLSVFDGLAAAAGRELLGHVTRLLAPGGLLLVTAGLCFDLKPFGVLARNGFGGNVDLRRLLDGLGLDLVRGDPGELHGFPGFDRGRIAGRAGELFMSQYHPRAIQTMVLRKAGEAPTVTEGD